MNIAAITIMATTIGVATQATGMDKAKDWSVKVCVENTVGFSILPLAEQVASQMFSAAGVTINWHQGLAGCPVEGIRVTLSPLSDHAPSDLPPSAMAYALPYEGNHIVIFYDRLQRKVKGTQISTLLSQVLAHEVTHILQGIHRHSDTGLMKANWDGSDYQTMMWKPLPFAQEDIELIHHGLAARATRTVSQK